MGSSTVKLFILTLCVDVNACSNIAEHAESPKAGTAKTEQHCRGLSPWRGCSRNLCVLHLLCQAREIPGRVGVTLNRLRN